MLNAPLPFYENVLLMSTLMMETGRSSEFSVNFNQFTCLQISEDCNLHSHGKKCRVLHSHCGLLAVVFLQTYFELPTTCYVHNMDDTPLPEVGTILGMNGNFGWQLCFAYKLAGEMFTSHLILSYINSPRTLKLIS